MERRERRQLDESDLQWRDDRSTSQTMALPSHGSIYYLPNDMPSVNSTVESNSHTMVDSLFRTGPLHDYPATSMIGASSSSITDPWMMASGSSLYQDIHNPMWEQPAQRSPSIENMFPVAGPVEQQSFLPNEQEQSTFGGLATDYSHIPSQLQEMYDPSSTFMGPMENTMYMVPASLAESPNGFNDTTRLTYTTIHAARNEEGLGGMTRMSEVDHQDKPYAYLIYEALRTAEGHKLTLQGIYRWFEENTNKSSDPSSKGWQNSIRHNLSMNAGFVMHTEPSPPGKPKTSYWTLTEEAIQKGIHSTTRYRTAGLKKPTKSENSSPKRRESGRKGGKASAKFRNISQKSSEHGGFNHFQTSPPVLGIKTISSIQPRTQ